MPAPFITSFFGAAAGGAATRGAQELQRLYANQLSRPRAITLPRDLLGGVGESGGNERNYYITFKFKKYERRGILEQPFYDTVGAYNLPIPKELVDTTSVNYEDVSLGPVTGMAAEAISYATGTNVNLENAGLATAASAAAAAGTAGAATARGLANRVPGGLGAVAREAVQNAGNLARSLTGLTPNPFQTTLFKNPNFRSHRFSWTFIPRDEQESVDLRDLMRAFKYHMLPGTAGRGVLFTFPEILEIKLYPDDRFMYKFKPCVLKAMSVNYAPNGPSFYRRTDAPTAVTISVDLQEIEFWTKNDFGPASQTETGGA